ncbi:hypothetical protein DPMN_112651 [Dreissena polymorpha]|uniref:Secreted protein n=1 Tax=Dreissena polymorpha TaxID=45954 RepID=A0A9D4KGH9_DREPO|nr:hypothetical protein DPMN_112651 [Dreissena polymorpha]
MINGLFFFFFVVETLIIVNELPPLIQQDRHRTGSTSLSSSWSRHARKRSRQRSRRRYSMRPYYSVAEQDLGIAGIRDVATPFVSVHVPTGHIDSSHVIPFRNIMSPFHVCWFPYGIHTCCSHRALFVYEH